VTKNLWRRLGFLSVGFCLLILFWAVATTLALRASVLGKQHWQSVNLTCYLEQAEYPREVSATRERLGTCVTPITRGAIPRPTGVELVPSPNVSARQIAIALQGPALRNFRGWATVTDDSGSATERAGARMLIVAPRAIRANTEQGATRERRASSVPLSIAVLLYLRYGDSRAPQPSDRLLYSAQRGEEFQEAAPPPAAFTAVLRGNAAIGYVCVLSASPSSPVGLNGIRRCLALAWTGLAMRETSIPSIFSDQYPDCSPLLALAWFWDEWIITNATSA
jgi:hypothetical protein